MWNLAIRAPVFITMCVVTVLVLGTVFFFQTGLDLLPDISVPVVVVQTIYPGASAEDVERDVSKPLEDAFASLNYVEAVRSTSQEGVSVVTLEFNMDYSARQASADVRERLATVRSTLPDGVNEPVIRRFDTSSLPVMTVGVQDRQGRNLADLRKLVDDNVKPRLERVPGVASATISGGREKQVLVSLDATKLASYNIPVEQVVRAIQSNNLSLPAGRITQGQRELVLRTANEFRSVDDLRGLAVAGSAEGAPVRLGDIADVREGIKDTRSITRINGQEAVSLAVFKQSGTNTVQVADAALKEVARIQRDRPDLNVFNVFDQSTNVRTFNDDLYRSLIIGGLAAALVVFLFFRDLRNTVITVVGLPIVIIASFGAIYLMGFTLNMVTLLALSLVVGLLIDDAIVVRENIFRHMEQGEDPRTAAKLGTAEIARAVIAVSLVIVAVFFPITLTKGLVGRFLNQFGLVVAVAVLLSLLEALTLAPMLSAFFFRRAEGKRREAPLLAAWGRAYDRAEGLYKPVLRWALGHRVLVLGIGLAAFVAALALIPIMGSELQPEIDRGFFYASMELPAGTSLAETDIVARKMEAVIRAQPEVKVVYATVGGGAFASGSGVMESEKANFFVTTGIGHAFQPMNRLRKEFATWPELTNARTNVSPLGEESLGAGSSSLSTFGSKVVQVALHGSDMNALSRAADAVTTRLRENGHGFTDVTSSLRPGKPELRVLVDEDRASEVGLSPAAVATTLRSLVNGDSISKLRRADEDIDITVQLRPQDMQQEDAILSIPVVTPTGATVRLASVATLAPATGPGRIDRENRERQVVISANFGSRTLSEALTDMQQALQDTPLPAGVRIVPFGQSEQFGETFSSLLLALGLSVLFVYMILASEFGSFTQPLVIMVALPLAGVGAFGMLFAAGFPISMMAMIGIILLMGLVAKNSILLVDYTNTLRSRGMPRREALLTAGPVRLRPILMTTAAMIMGMLPLALGLGTGSEMRQPMGLAVIGGLVTSTILTLIVVPVVYSIMDEALERFRGRGQGKGTAGRPVHVQKTVGLRGPHP